MYLKQTYNNNIEDTSIVKYPTFYHGFLNTLTIFIVVPSSFSLLQLSVVSILE